MKQTQRNQRFQPLPVHSLQITPRIVEKGSFIDYQVSRDSMISERIVWQVIHWVGYIAVAISSRECTHLHLAFIMVLLSYTLAKKSAPRIQHWLQEQHADEMSK